MDHPVSVSPLRGNSANSGVTPSPKPNALSTFGSGRERSSSVTSRRHTSSTRSLLSITENQAEEEIEEPKHSISKSSSVIVMAQQSTRNLSASSKSCGGLSATGLSRMAFMSSKEALAVLGSNFQLNNIVPEEEEDEDCNEIHKSVELKSKGSARSSVHVLAHSSKSQEMKKSHLSEGFSFDDSQEDLISGLQDELPQTFSSRLSAITPKRHSATTRNVSDDVFIPPPIIVTKDLSGGSISEIELAENVVSLKDRLQIVFEHLSLSAITKTNRAKVGVEKRVLNDVSGVFRPGRLTAIIGLPGAGMTSLLHAIAAIKQNSQITGNVFVNGNLMQGLDIRQILGFIFEDDVICPTMTVKEAITMSSQLRMPNRTAEQHTKAIDQVIQAFGLTAVENTMIRYLKSSNGERKRCAIAIEVVTQQRILFLDRCTSGLDICSAVTLIRMLKELAKTGFTVVTTIRQPNSHIFHMFDEFLLMADGNIIFQGTPKTSLTYFSNLGFQCPKDSNPADYYLSTIINPDTDSVYSCIEGLLNVWLKSEEFGELVKESKNTKDWAPISTTIIKRISSSRRQFSVLLSNEFRTIFRHASSLRQTIFLTTFITTLIGFSFYQTNRMTSFAAIQNRNGALYCLTIISFMAGSITSMHSFRTNRAMFLRELRCGYYTTAPYLASKLLAGLPFIVLFSSLQLTVTYFLIGFQNDARKLFVLLCTCCLLSLIGIAIGALIATITLLFEASLVDNISLFSPFIFFSSLYVNFDSTTPVLYWIKWLNPVQYGFECLMKNEYNGFLLQLQLDGVTNIIAGETIIKQQGLSPERLDVTNSLAILLCMALCLLFAVFWTLKRIGTNIASKE